MHADRRFTTQANREGGWGGHASLVKDVSADGGVHSAQRVVQQKDVGVRVEGSGQADPRPLTPAQADPAVTDQRAVSVGHDLQVLKQGA